MSRASLGRAALMIASVLTALALYSSAAYASGPPIVTVGAASNLTLNTANLNGTVDSNGASTTYKFEYGKSKLYGSSTTVKTIKSGSAPVSEVLVGLEPLTTYHFRVSATNSFGTTVSEDVQFEMMLRWKVNGKPLSEAGPTEYLGKEQTFKVVGKVIVTPVEITCEVDPGNVSRGVLEDHLTLHLKGCVTIINGNAAKKCAPPDTELTFNSVFAVGGTQALTLGASCPIGPKVDLSGAGFGVGPRAEQVGQSVALSASLPAHSGLTMIYTSEWKVTGANEGLPFGIS